MHYDPWLTEISLADIEAAQQRKAAREALIAEQAAEIARLRACIVKLEEALDAAGRVLHKAGEQFSEYAKQHAAKSTAVSDLKAAFNKQWAERCFSAYWRASEGGKDE